MSWFGNVRLSNSGRTEEFTVQLLVFPQLFQTKSVFLVWFPSNVINPHSSPYRLIWNQTSLCSCSIWNALAFLPPKAGRCPKSLGAWNLAWQRVFSHIQPLHQTSHHCFFCLFYQFLSLGVILTDFTHQPQRIVEASRSISRDQCVSNLWFLWLHLIVL